MKKILLVFSLLISILSYSQTRISENQKLEKIGSCKGMGLMLLELNKLNEDYVQFNYLDAKFPKLVNYKSFFIKQNDLEEIYSLFTDFSNHEDGSSKIVELEDGEELIFDYVQVRGKTVIKVSHIDKNRLKGEMKQLSKKQVDKAFGKSK